MHVVLVDPSRTVLKILARTLVTQGHDVHPFTSSAKALHYIKSNHLVDALITSAQLSPMSGQELCLEVRRLASCRRPIYILLMSSDDEPSSLIEALNNGADDFIRKPPITEELYARLRAANRIVSMQRELVGQATTDFLTGSLNRRAFFENAKELCARAELGGPLSTIMLDIDHFKRINDTYGHSAGDEVLRRITHEISEGASIIGRLGGEEFAILLDGVSQREAVEIAENLRDRLQKLEISVGQKTISLTCSFGVSQWQISDTIDVLLDRADGALYKAKKNGRNRVEVSECVLDEAGYDRSASMNRSVRRGMLNLTAA